MIYTVTHFADAIRKLNPEGQATTQNKVASNWTIHYAQFPWVEPILMSQFKDGGAICVTRGDIYATTDPLARFVKTLYWGYPGGFPSNNQYLRNILDKANEIVECLPEIGTRLTVEQYTALFDRLKSMVSGMSVSTISKILAFWKIKAASSESVIVDQFVMECIHLFDDFWGMSTDASSADAYYGMVKKINGLAKKMSVSPEQTELFLFKTGKTVKENRHGLFRILLGVYTGDSSEEEE